MRSCSFVTCSASASRAMPTCFASLSSRPWLPTGRLTPSTPPPPAAAPAPKKQKVDADEARAVGRKMRLAADPDYIDPDEFRGIGFDALRVEAPRHEAPDVMLRVEHVGDAPVEGGS